MVMLAFWKNRDQKFVLPVSQDDPLPVVLETNPTIDIGAVSLVGSTAGTVTSVASSASAVTLLAGNTSRIGASVFNDSTAILYLIAATTTPTSSTYTVKMSPGDYWETPWNYTGILKGIWASANGSARVTEYA